MKQFYKLNPLQVGSGEIVPESFIEYTVGNEPLELVEALEQEALEQELQAKVNEAKEFLSSTDYKMTVDYFATLSKEEQDSLIKLRAEAREFIRSQA